jgi:subfamily B ATP-binding cassette protein MsbA
MEPMTLLSLLKVHRWKLCAAFFCIALANLLNLVFPWSVKLIVDNVFARGDLSLLTLILAGLLAVSFLKALTGYGRSRWVIHTAEAAAHDLRVRLYRHLLRLPVTYFGDASSGTLISRVMGDVDCVKKFLLNGLPDFLYALFNVFFVVAALFVMNWKLAVIAVFFAVFLAATYLRWGRRLRSGYADLRQKHSELSGRLGEVFSGIRTVHAYHRGFHEDRRFVEGHRALSQSALKTHQIDAFFGACSDGLASLGLVALLWFGSHLVLAGKMTPGTLMAFYIYTGILFLPVVKLATVNNYYQEAMAALDRVSHTLEQKPGPKEFEKPVLLERLGGEIIFERVSFSYESGRRALCEIDLAIAPGQMVALVGPSGSGKTTLAGLLARFFDPTSGRILIDGHDLRNLDLAAYRSKIALVLQDDFLFSGSVEDNILYGRLNALPEEVSDAAKLSNAHDFIMGIPERYSARIGQNGVKLSGGQRQRIVIARAILKNPSILILDEATSAVDSAAERLIAQALGRLRKARTTLVIAHRLSTVKSADKIVVLDEGRITGVGSHEELISTSALYRSLCQSQLIDDGLGVKT